MLKKINLISNWKIAGTALVGLLAGLSGHAAEVGGWRHYDLYSPKVEYGKIYDPAGHKDPYLYNHCATMAWFDGEFHAVWQANKANSEGKAGQVLLHATSRDFITWSEPAQLIGPESGLDLQGNFVMKQPGLLRFDDNELWCIWHLWGGGESKEGLHLAKLRRGEKHWVTERFHHRERIGEHTYFGYTMGDPIRLKSGRVLSNLIMISEDSPQSQQYRYATTFYTDDAGKTWKRSNEISLPGDAQAAWEPTVHVQKDGALRMFLRNIGRYPPPIGSLLTTTGHGAQAGEELTWERDAKISRMEVLSSRPQSLLTADGRHVLLNHDVTFNETVYAGRLNAATAFSRSGHDDFVAGPGFSRRNEISSYAQGIVHDGSFCIAYTVGNADLEPRKIVSARFPVPPASPYMLYARDREELDMRRVPAPVHWERANKDYVVARPVDGKEGDRRTVTFADRATAGMELDSLDWEKGEALEVVMDLKIDKLQGKGNLVVLTFGDNPPTRLLMPGNRPGELYLEAADGSRPVGKVPLAEWVKLQVKISRNVFEVQIGGSEPVMRQLPNHLQNPRLYLGDGYSVDYIESNRGSEFQVDRGTLGSRVVRSKE